MRTNVKDVNILGRRGTRNSILEFVRNANLRTGTNQGAKSKSSEWKIWTGDLMEKLAIVYENPSVTSKYFEQNVSNIARCFRECKITFILIDDVYSRPLRLPNVDKSIIITKRQFSHPFYPSMIIDGIGRKNIGVLSYQQNIPGNTWLRRTLFLFAHELGHMYGLVHCKNEKCIMGFLEGNYSWKSLSEKKKIDRRILCKECRLRFGDLS